jgi:GT2 family glycosyltransferase
VSSRPVLSVVIPAYESHATLADCLAAIGRQTLRSFEVVLVDSSPSGRGAELARREFPWVRLEQSPRRMLPHEARNLGVSLAAADRIVFTDPDVYPIPEWLDRLAGPPGGGQEIVIGSVGCFGNGWTDVGAHLAKFDMWLPGGSRRPIDIAPTLNMLCPRSVFEALGGFRGELMIGDTIFSWNAAGAGFPIVFEPGALVWHHHLMSWRGLLRERFVRGQEFGRVRSRMRAWTRRRTALHLLASLLPLRWTRMMGRTLSHASRAGMLSSWVATLPIVATAHAAWLAGESRGLLGEIRGRAT